MKIWMKYLVGAILGALVAVVLPVEDTGLRDAITFLFDLSIRIGRYALIPLVLFSVPVAVFELNEDKDFWRNLGRCLVILVGAVLVLTVVGVIVAVIASPARIPLLADSAAPSSAPGIRELLLAVFPDTPFAALLNGQFLLPVFFLAVLIGLAFSHDRPATKPVLLIFDAMSRIFYQINTFFAEFLGILIIAVTARSVLELRATARPEVYRSLIVAIVVEVLVAALVIIPLMLRLFGGRKNPYRTLYALLAPAIAALVSGDVYFSLGALMKHSKESLGIRRRSNSLSLPLAMIFGRAGTALVTSTAFVVVLSSYSKLGVWAGSFLWILAVAPVLALVLGAAPGKGAMIALMSLCALYGRGFENGYLIAAPIALPLIAAGSFLDVLWAGSASLILARRAGHAQEKEARFFI
ncbi:MAG TPA: cation:dicarboxylase symporter family transporter [Rectinemataceae bacterium]|nr:cation:dicarboxylase symporter family transporter [Rectinemataceae bacterium]